IEVDLSPTTHSDPAALVTGARKEDMLVKTINMHIPGNRKLSRLLLPLPRVRLSNSILMAPIPGVEADAQADNSVAYPWHCGLTGDSDDEAGWLKGSSSGSNKDRQFVLKRAAQKGGSKEVAHRRQLFWHQQEICSRIRIRWRSNQSGRSGHMDPRSLFTLEDMYVDTVLRSGFQTRIFVGEQQAAYVDRLVSEVNCPTEAQSTVKIVVENSLDRMLQLQISARAVGSKDGVYGVESGVDSELALEASDALQYMAQGVQLLSAASVNTAFAAHLPDQNARQGQKFRFALPFTPQPTAELPPMPFESLPPNMPGAAPTSQPIVFDS
ncbi:hypothetical protein EC988_008150, partial [Linderina pennispora]